MENVNEALTLIAKAKEGILHFYNEPSYETNSLQEAMVYLDQAIDKLTTK